MAAVTRRAIPDKARPTSVTRLLNTARKARLSIFLPFPPPLALPAGTAGTVTVRKKKKKKEK